MFQGGGQVDGFKDYSDDYLCDHLCGIDGDSAYAGREAGRTEWFYQRGGGYLLGKEQGALHGRGIGEDHKVPRSRVYFVITDTEHDLRND